MVEKPKRSTQASNKRPGRPSSDRRGPRRRPHGERPGAGTRKPQRTVKVDETFVVHPKDIKPVDDGVLRVVVLGGCEEVGRNCTLLEYGNDIILIDMGLQFPEEDMPGIDYIIPNTAYLRGKEKRIRGVIITHGHYDHIGAIPHVLPKIGNPPIYGLPITNAIIRK
ncbi:MAG: MBL fold metallo-hydrolase, partial [Patescibacteria group bacterium]